MTLVWQIIKVVAWLAIGCGGFWYAWRVLRPRRRPAADVPEAKPWPYKNSCAYLGCYETGLHHPACKGSPLSPLYWTHARVHGMTQAAKDEYMRRCFESDAIPTDKLPLIQKQIDRVPTI